jgi:hypothetical protein
MWYDSLPEDLKNNPTVQKYKTPEDQVKAHLELQSVMGNDKVPIPKDENDAVAIATFNRALGIPEAPEGYELEDVKAEGFEEMQFGDEVFQQVAHKHGLTPKQANGLKASYVELLSGIHKASEEAHMKKLQETNAALNKEWGVAKEGKVKLAQAVMNKFAGNKENFDHINALVGDDPIALKFLAQVGEQFKEGSLGDMGTPLTGFTKTPAEAKQEYDVIMSNPKDLYWQDTEFGDKTIPKQPESARKQRVAYVEDLLKQMNAGSGNA